LVEILLKNTNNKILILTQTNNALDKFLMGCLKFTKDIVRFGGQCKEESLSQFIANSVQSQVAKNYYKNLQKMYQLEVEKLIYADRSNEEVFKKISQHYRLVEEINQLNLYSSINKKRIFGMTTSYAAHNNCINKMLKAEIVLIEEASEVLESHIVAALTQNTKHVIMIGGKQF
jgi:hypothetical protein